MIPKGNQRGGGAQLATHLMNAYDNERVEIVEVRGTVAQDLHGAFAEWCAQSKATQCQKYLYSLSVNPDHRQGPFGRAHYLDYVERAEKGLGLADQPRAIVFHVKEGREHCHVVWSRIDADRARAVHIPHDRQKLRQITQEYAREHGLTLPPGAQADRGPERFEDQRGKENLAEKQQQERTGISKAERRAALTAAWRESDSGKALVQALAARGYRLAEGNKRSYVVVDRYGEIHSLARQIEGVKVATLRERLGDQNGKLQKVAEVVKQVMQAPPSPAFNASAPAKAAAAEAPALKAAPVTTPTTAPPTTPIMTTDQRRDALAEKQAARRAELDAIRNEMTARHASEREALVSLQAGRDETALSNRFNKRSSLISFLQRITGLQKLKVSQHRQEDQFRAAIHGQQREALNRKHERERHDIDRQYGSLEAVETKEQRSVQTALRRKTRQSLRTRDGQAEGSKVRKALLSSPKPDQTPEHKPGRVAAFFKRIASGFQSESPAPPDPKPPAKTATQSAFRKVAEQPNAAPQGTEPRPKPADPAQPSKAPTVPVDPDKIAEAYALAAQQEQERRAAHRTETRPQKPRDREHDLDL